MKSVALMALLSAVSAADEVCSVVKHRKMQGDFTNCSRMYTEEHFNTAKGDTCQLVKSVVGKCGELWQRCHTSREVRRMRDLHIEALIRQYGAEGGLDGCDIVKEYRRSGRTLDEEDEALCSDEKTIEFQTKFQTCSHSTSTSVYQTIQDLTSVKIISDKLCKALTTIGTVCVKHLNECFAEDDVRQMRKSHVEQMKAFLLRIVHGKAPSNALDNCKVAIDMQESIDTIEYSYDEDDDYIVPVVESDEVETTEESITEPYSVEAKDNSVMPSSTVSGKESRDTEFIDSVNDTAT